MRIALLVAVASLTLLLVPARAEASTRLSSDAYVVQVEDAWGFECEGPTSGWACVGSHDRGASDSPGDDVLSIETGPVRVLVELRPRSLPLVGEVVAPLLPDGSVSMRFDDVKAPFPVFPAYHALREETGPPPSEGVAGMEANESRWRVWAPFFHPEEGVYERDYFYSEWEGERLASYDEVYVPNELLRTSSDEAALFPVWIACDWWYVRNATATACADLGGAQLAQAYMEFTPEARTGVNADEATTHLQSRAPHPPTPSRAPPATPGSPGSPLPAGIPPRLHSEPPPPPSTLLPAPSILDSADAPGQSRSDRALPLVSHTRSDSTRVAPGSPFLLAACGATGLALLGLLLYHRLTRRQILEQPTRQALLDLVTATPGISPSTAARHLGIDFRAVAYHARLLQKTGEISVVKAPARRLRLYRAGARPATDPHDPLARATDHPVSRAMLFEIARAGATTRERLQETVNAPRATLHWHVRRLIDAGIVHENATEHRPARLTIPAALRERVVDRLLGFGTTVGGGPAREALVPSISGAPSRRPLE